MQKNEDEEKRKYKKKLECEKNCAMKNRKVNYFFGMVDWKMWPK